MNAIHIQQLRNHLTETLDRVCEDHEPMIITREGKQAVLISYEDFSALQETLYLLSSPAMAERLRESLASMQQGGGEERDLIECDG